MDQKQETLLTKSAKIKPPTPEAKAQALAKVRAELPKFRALYARLSPTLQPAFRNQFDGEMGRMLDEPE